MRVLLLWSVLIFLTGRPASGVEIEKALDKMKASIVQVSFSQINENRSKTSQTCIGTVVDQNGLIAFSSDYMLQSVPDDRFVDFKVKLAGNQGKPSVAAEFVLREHDLNDPRGQWEGLGW